MLHIPTNYWKGGDLDAACPRLSERAGAAAADAPDAAPYAAYAP